MAALGLAPLSTDSSFSAKAYEALRAAIVGINIYEASEDDLRLDERALAEGLGVSRTPIREALARLEHDGLVVSIPRRGYFIVRKSRAELVDIITVWAALESMAVRLVTQRATAEEIASLRAIFAGFDPRHLATRLDEYSDANVHFHNRILELSKCETLRRTTDGLLIHVRAIRHRAMGENRRFERSLGNHVEIIAAVEARDTELAARLVRDHALELAAHVTTHDDDL